MSMNSYVQQHFKSSGLKKTQTSRQAIHEFIGHWISHFCVKQWNLSHTISQ